LRTAATSLLGFEAPGRVFWWALLVICISWANEPVRENRSIRADATILANRITLRAPEGIPSSSRSSRRGLLSGATVNSGHLGTQFTFSPAKRLRVQQLSACSLSKLWSHDSMPIDNCAT
jgi:hypothetical protein